MNKYKKKIIFAGMPDMGLICLAKLVASGFNIAGIIPPKKTDRTYGEFINFVSSYNIPIIHFNKNLDEDEFIDNIKAIDADLGVVCSYNHKFPSRLLKAVKGGFINTHPSLLPDYRGPNPYTNVIINNETQTGVTFHYMDENFDTGNIVAQAKLRIEPNETMGTLFCKLNRLASDSLVELLKIFEITDKFDSQKQPEGEFKYAKNYDLSLGNTYIDWSWHPEEIERFIRALNPFIGAYTRYKGEFIRVNSAGIEKKKHKELAGTVCEAKNSVKVACDGGFIHITSLQYGSYVVSDAYDFIKRSGIKRGDSFNNG